MDKLNYLDVGASNFKIPQNWIYFKSLIQPILFEPDKRSYHELKNNSFQVHNVALGEKKERKPFYLTRKPACSSNYKPNMDFLRRFPDKERWEIVDEVDMELISLDELKLKAHFIKLDTQGSELDILKGSVQTLENVLGLEVEVSFQHIYQNQPLFEDVKNFLKINGFEFYDFVTEYRYNRNELDRTGQLAFADALFLRNPEHVKEIDNSLTTQFFNVICNVYKKFDLIIP